MLRIDPTARPIWRSPQTLQFGVDPVLAVLDDVGPGTEHLVAALVGGLPLRLLRRLARDTGVPQPELTALLRRLRPVLRSRGARIGLPLAVETTGPADLAAPLAARIGTDEGATARLVVVTAHHLVPPAATVRWLALDTPHLAVVFGDQAVTIGPHVIPGITPCLRCAEEHRIDADPARAAIAAQLLRRGSARTAGSTALGLTVAARVAEAIAAIRVGRATGLEGSTLRIAPSGAVRRAPAPWHERCSCRVLESAAPRGTATATAPPAASPTSAPTTAAAGPAPA